MPMLTEEIVAEDTVAEDTVAAAAGVTMLLSAALVAPDEMNIVLSVMELPCSPICPVFMLLATRDPVEKPSARSVAHPIGPATQEYSIVIVDAVACPVPKRRRPPGA